MKFNLNMDKFPFGVNVSGLIQSEKGLGTAVRSDIEALKAARIPYILNNITDLGSANVDKTFNDFSGDKSLDPVIQEIFNNKIDVVIIQFHPAFLIV